MSTKPRNEFSIWYAANSSSLPTFAIFSVSCHKPCSDSVHCSWLSILNLEIPVLASTHQGRAVSFQSLCPILAQCEIPSEHGTSVPLQLLCPAQTPAPLTQSPSAAHHEFRFYRTFLGMSCNISCVRGEVLPTWDSVRVGFVHCVHPPWMFGWCPFYLTAASPCRAARVTVTQSSHCPNEFMFGDNWYRKP